ncbi:5-(carboxyamino)imidazole ribonucleotide synthase [Paenalkalicoccus suaedae]|uniref:N5-carboxyaminoimidazole ribonucleotide synthase n=1 Tax=Paenalkalicoccus suaedae TaxID=2592382 RepID=A0A859FAQ2_9BACI|nr:5-(carboxyamino)imidazole ribonucleotide synthase [Paenalkalicoccus suaedae]QKS70413.1 5-(carboxyamino)imidazole ribonucleotide synthase [Paenalkalicoccus suaedae]
MTFIKPGSTIGILGGGQLGRMMALSARNMGYRISVLEPQKDSPCGQVADHEVVAAYDDKQGAEDLSCDVLTYEFENISAETADHLASSLHFPQGSKLLLISQDRLREKEAIESYGLPVAPYKKVESDTDLADAVSALGLPLVVKTTRGGYDGKGQLVINKGDEVSVRELEDNGPFVAEQWIPFDCEVSVIVTRSVSGETATFPVAENIHRNGILHQSIVPARVSDEVQERARKAALTLAESVSLVGTLAVEMFVRDGEIVINEIAPRPHNSGHYTMNACATSQFEQHIRAICDWPLGETTLLTPTVMVNLIGDEVERAVEMRKELGSAAHVHIYGKKEARPGRKMGHVNVLTSDVEATLEQLNVLEEAKS